MTNEHFGWKPRPRRRRRRPTALVLTTLALTGTVVSLQQTSVLPLLPQLPSLLNTTADNSSWLLTATLLSGGVATPTIARLADMFGKKRMMMIALAVMVVGSALGAFSHVLFLLITARALQGVGMSLVPIGIAIMRDELPRDKVPLGVALMSATLAIGAGVGPPLSGLISEDLSWHAIFWVTAAVGSVMLGTIAFVVAESPIRGRGPFDYRGALLLSAALTAILLTLSKADQWGWGTTLVTAILGAVLLVIWIPLELRVRHPLVDIRVASRPAVFLVNVASVLIGFAMFVNLLVTTQLLQLPTNTGYGLGLDILTAGLYMVPIALVLGVMAPVAASVTRQFGPLTTMLVGSLLMSAAYVARVFLSTNLWQIVIGAMLVGVGTPMTFAAMPTLIMRAVPATETASANGLNALMRTIGTSTCSATMAAVTMTGLVRVGGHVFPSLDALVTMFWLASATALLSALLVIVVWRMGHFVDETSDSVEHRPDTLSSRSSADPTAVPQRGSDAGCEQADSRLWTTGGTQSG